MKTIGFLNSASESAFTDLVTAFREGLAEEGFTEGDNVKIISHWADGNYHRLPEMAADLIRQRVDVLATTGGVVSAQAGMAATQTIPVLFVSGYDPAEVEFVSGKKGPTANATGVSVSGTDSVLERLEHFCKLVPAGTKIAVLVRPGTYVSKLEIAEAKKANLVVIEATSENDLAKAFASARKQGLGALLVSADPFFTSRREKIVALAAENKMPTGYPWREYVKAGGLMSYGASLSEAYRQIGKYAGQILKDVQPRKLAVRVAKTPDFELVIHQETARALGIQIPQTLRAQAEVL